MMQECSARILVIITDLIHQWRMGRRKQHRCARPRAVSASYHLTGDQRQRRSAREAAGDGRSTVRRLAMTPFDGTCRWCSGEVHPPRRTFCSGSCVHEYRLRSSNAYLRRCVYERDLGVCAGCNVDTSIIGAALRSRGAGDDDQAGLARQYCVHPSRRLWARKHRGCIYDVDHIRRVSDGGGLAGLENVRTLCLACHKAVTWSQAGKSGDNAACATSICTV